MDARRCMPEWYITHGSLSALSLHVVETGYIEEVYAMCCRRRSIEMSHNPVH